MRSIEPDYEAFKGNTLKMIALAQGQNRRNNFQQSSYDEKAQMSRNNGKMQRSRSTADFDNKLIKAILGKNLDNQSLKSLERSDSCSNVQPQKLYFVEKSDSEKSSVKKRRKTTIITKKRSRDGSISKERQVIYQDYGTDFMKTMQLRMSKPNLNLSSAITVGVSSVLSSTQKENLNSNDRVLESSARIQHSEDL